MESVVSTVSGAVGATAGVDEEGKEAPVAERSLAERAMVVNDLYSVPDMAFDGTHDALAREFFLLQEQPTIDELSKAVIEDAPELEAVMSTRTWQLLVGKVTQRTRTFDQLFFEEPKHDPLLMMAPEDISAAEARGDFARPLGWYQTASKGELLGRLGHEGESLLEAHGAVVARGGFTAVNTALFTIAHMKAAYYLRALACGREAVRGEREEFRRILMDQWADETFHLAYAEYVGENDPSTYPFFNESRPDPNFLSALYTLHGTMRPLFHVFRQITEGLYEEGSEGD